MISIECTEKRAKEPSLFHPKHHLSPNTFASPATVSPRLEHARLQPTQWLCIQAIGSGYEHDSKVAEVYLNRIARH